MLKLRAVDLYNGIGVTVQNFCGGLDDARFA
jgi:hypothetical protein